MNVYETDEEKVEALKKWWKENGVSVVVGVLIGLGAIGGWRAWNGYQETQAQQASAVFERLLSSAETDDAKTRLERAKVLAEEFPSSIYATLATLVRARVQVEAGNLGAARQALEQVVADSPETGIRMIAALRLARILIAQGNLDAAQKLIAEHRDGGSFAGAFASLRGDIAKAQGNSEQARIAYEQALAAGARNAQQLRLRLDNLPPAG